MSTAETKVASFFANAKNWREELGVLRGILCESPLTEDFKWQSPCYTFENANIATVWGFTDYCTVSFFKGVLLKDPQGILVAPGENSRSVRMVKFTSLAQIVGAKDTLHSYILEAIEAEKAGLKVTFEKDDLAYPDELESKLAEDPDFSAAFDALTPGRRRGYVLHFTQPKQSKTRASRIEKHVPRIMIGKGMHDR